MSELNYNDMDKITDETVEKLFNYKVGYSHLTFLQERYWFRVASEIIAPAFLKIHKSLVSKKYTEKNKLVPNFGSTFYFYVPTKSKHRKVICHTGQSYNILYVINMSKNNKEIDTFHIRFYYNKFNMKNNGKEYKKYIETIQSAIDHTDYLNEYSDDNSKYPKRRSLDFYKSIDFELDKFDAKHQIYGDGRDGGYIASINFLIRKCDVGMMTPHFLEMIATSTISNLSYILKLKLKNLGQENV